VTAGHTVTLSNSRGPDTLHDVADSMGFAPVDAGSLREGGRLMQIGGPLSALHALKQD
jgi:predicted dinucleotide-binding enzyme